MIFEANFNIDTLSRFSTTLRYNITTYLDLYRLFMNNNQPLILSYFKNQIAEPDILSFDFLNKMIIEAKKINDLIIVHRSSFDRVDDWGLLEFLENVRIKLDTVNNAAKWLKSSKAKNSWQKTSIQFNTTLGVDETIEDISKNNNNSLDPQNNWVQITLENNLLEKDYNTQGGTVVQLNKSILSKPNIHLNSVVDSELSGEKLYGIDIDRKIQWTDNDIQLLSYKNTVIQSINILIVLRQGDVPEFLNFGVDPRFAVGNNLSIFKNFRVRQQLEAVIASDDTLRDFQITNISYYNSKLKIEYNINTLYDFTLNNVA